MKMQSWDLEQLKLNSNCPCSFGKLYCLQSDDAGIVMINVFKTSKVNTIMNSVSQNIKNCFRMQPRDLTV